MKTKMTQQVDDPISVVSIFDQKRSSTMPFKVVYKNRSYIVNKVGLHHLFYRGETLHHVFSVLCEGNVYLRLEHETKFLTWKLKEISDGEAD